VAVASAGPYASLHLAPDKITMPAPHHSVFHRPDALHAAPTNRVKALNAKKWRKNDKILAISAHLENSCQRKVGAM